MVLILRVLNALSLEEKTENLDEVEQELLLCVDAMRLLNVRKLNDAPYTP